MVNKTLVLENHHGIMEHKWKQERQCQSSNKSRPRVGMSSAGLIQCAPQKQPRAQL
jgi:hypothetical protein